MVVLIDVCSYGKWSKLCSCALFGLRDSLRRYLWGFHRMPDPITPSSSVAGKQNVYRTATWKFLLAPFLIITCNVIWTYNILLVYFVLPFKMAGTAKVSRFFEVARSMATELRLFLNLDEHSSYFHQCESYTYDLHQVSKDIICKRWLFWKQWRGSRHDGPIIRVDCFCFWYQLRIVRKYHRQPSFKASIVQNPRILKNHGSDLLNIVA